MTIPSQVLAVILQLTSKGYEAYLVGGCIRDTILGENINDYDVATNATPEQMKEVFPKIYGVGEDFGTMLVISSEYQIEMTTYRKETYREGSRKPVVTYSDNILDDLHRRDFNLNAIAYNPLTNEFLDPCNGMKDLENRLIDTQDVDRCFRDDPLRIIRCLRLAQRNGLSISDRILSVINNYIPLLDNISNERKRMELEKLFKHPIVKYENELCSVYPYLDFHSEVRTDLGFIENLLLRAIKDDLKDELKLSNDEHRIMKSCWQFAYSDINYFCFKAILREIGMSNIEVLARINHSFRFQLEHLKVSKMIWNVNQLEIDGNDLIELGLKGFSIKLMLDWLLKEVMDEKLENSRDLLLEKVKSKL